MIYQPAEDSCLLSKEVAKRAKGKSFLDMGSGSGILAETAEKAQAKSVLATDIQDDVVKHLKSKNIPCIKSDLFEKVKGKFDIIAFNPPYLPHDAREDKESQIATTGGKKGDEVILKFLKQAKAHMKKDSIILLLLSSLTPRAKILALLSALGLKHKVIAEKRIFFEKLEVWEIKITQFI